LLDIFIIRFSFTLFLPCDKIMIIDKTAWYFSSIPGWLSLIFLNNCLYICRSAFFNNAGINNELLFHFHYFFLSLHIELVVDQEQLHMIVSAQLFFTKFKKVDIFITNKDTFLRAFYFNWFAYLVAPHFYIAVQLDAIVVLIGVGEKF